MKNILFLCTGNSCRSQMAEGFAKSLLSKHSFYSAGTVKHGINPRAVQMMKEVGIDISHHYSKTLDDLSNIAFDLIVTVCSDADDNCPVIPGAKIIHHGFDDPPRMTAGFENEEMILNVYRSVRDEIKDFVLTLESLI